MALPACIIPYKDEKQIFSTIFPFIAECISILKEKSYTDLSITLQKLESYVFIDCISPKLVNAGIVPFTIHDSFILRKEHQDEAFKLISTTFEELFEIAPKFHSYTLK